MPPFLPHVSILKFEKYGPSSTFYVLLLHVRPGPVTKKLSLVKEISHNAKIIYTSP